MKNHLGEEVVFGPRSDRGTHRREAAAAAGAVADASATALRARILAAIPGETPRLPRPGLWALAIAIAAPVAASLVGAWMFSIT